MRWDELDLKLGVWTLPAKRTKNRQAHIIYLPLLAIELIQSLRPIDESSDHIFESHRNPGSHIHLDSLTTAITRLQRPRKDNEREGEARPNVLKDVSPFTVHDLRRSAATAWAENLKVAPHVIERMLNHQPQNKLIATYQRATYVDEQKEAWRKWGKMVEAVIAQEPKNVIPIGKRRNSKIKAQSSV